MKYAAIILASSLLANAVPTAQPLELNGEVEKRTFGPIIDEAKKIKCAVS